MLLRQDFRLGFFSPSRILGTNAVTTHHFCKSPQLVPSASPAVDQFETPCTQGVTLHIRKPRLQVRKYNASASKPFCPGQAAIIMHIDTHARTFFLVTTHRADEAGVCRKIERIYLRCLPPPSHSIQQKKKKRGEVGRVQIQRGRGQEKKIKVTKEEDKANEKRKKKKEKRKKDYTRQQDNRQGRQSSIFLAQLGTPATIRPQLWPILKYLLPSCPSHCS